VLKSEWMKHKDFGKSNCHSFAGKSKDLWAASSRS